MERSNNLGEASRNVVIIIDTASLGQSLRPLRHISYLNSSGLEVMYAGVGSAREVQSVRQSVRLEHSCGSHLSRQAFLALRRLAGWRPSTFIFRPIFARVVGKGLGALEVVQDQVAAVLVEDIYLLEPALEYFPNCWVVFDAREDHSSAIAESLIWRIFRKPEVVRIIRKSFRRVNRLISVSPQIQKRLASQSGREVSLIPNVPNYSPQLPPERTGPLKIVFHGQVNPSRRVAESIVTVAKLKSVEFHVYPSGQAKHLRGIDKIGSRYSNVFIHQLVAPADIPSMLTSYDVGFVAYPPINLNLQAALPNKFFEYVFAGLPPIVQSGSSMSHYVARWGFGFEVDMMSEGSVRRLAESITRDQIEEQRDRLPSIWEELSEKSQKANFLAAVLPPESGVKGYE